MKVEKLESWRRIYSSPVVGTSATILLTQPDILFVFACWLLLVLVLIFFISMPILYDYT